MNSIDNDTVNLIASNLDTIGELANTSNKLSFMNNGEISKSSNSLYRSFRGYLPSWGTNQYSDNISNLTSFKLFLDRFVENPINNNIAPRMIEVLDKAKKGLESLLNVYIYEEKSLNIEVTDSLLSNIEYYKTSIKRNSNSELNPELTTNRKIQSLFEKILSGKNDDELKFYDSQPSHRVFSLLSENGKIFKLSTSNNEETEDRYKTMLNARVLCKVDNLFRLVVPEARKFEVEYEGRIYKIIEEEKLDVDLPDVQEELYHNASDEFAETVRQQTTFICKTKFSDVEYRNLPIINGTNNVGLIDLEENAGAKVGILGGKVNGGNRRGLINCVNEKQIPVVVAEFNKHFPEIDCEEAVKARKLELNDEAGLYEYYTDNDISTADQPIVFDAVNFEFDSYPEDVQKELYKLAENLVKEINLQIASQTTLTTKKRRREVYIDLSPRSIFFGYNDVRADRKKIINFRDDKDFRQGSYLNIVIKNMIESGMIYKKIGENPSIVILQA